MINPVSKPGAAREIPPSTQSYQQAADYRSSIRYGRKNSFPLFSILQKYLSEIWNWIKYSIFFCVFDAEEEREKRLSKQIEEFVIFYFEKKAVPSVASERQVKDMYNDLDSEIKEEIETEISKILKGVKSKMTSKSIEILTKKILDHPLRPIKDKHKPKGEQEIEVLGRAISVVKDKIAGYISRGRTDEDQ